MSTPAIHLQRMTGLQIKCSSSEIKSILFSETFVDENCFIYAKKIPFNVSYVVYGGSKDKS